MTELQRQRILITGARQGIGAAVAQRFRDDGADLCIFGRSGMDEALRRLGGGNVIAITGDVRQLSDLQRAVRAMQEAFGGVDGVVTAAGITRIGPVTDLSVDDFRQVIDINVTGAWLTVKAALPAMPSSGGWVVMLGSVYGAGGAPDRSAYCASKGAVHNLVRALAVELGPRGVRVNAVAPTGVRTPMVEDLIARGLYDVEAVSGRAPLNRLATPEQVAAACAFLASPQAAMTTGAILPVDGGWLAESFIYRRRGGA